MKTLDEAFQDWLDEPMCEGVYAETRRIFAKKTKANFADLEWAFASGYTRGQQSMMERK